LHELATDPGQPRTGRQREGQPGLPARSSTRQLDDGSSARQFVTSRIPCLCAVPLRWRPACVAVPRLPPPSVLLCSALLSLLRPARSPGGAEGTRRFEGRERQQQDGKEQSTHTSHWEQEQPRTVSRQPPRTSKMAGEYDCAFRKRRFRAIPRQLRGRSFAHNY
jgi:hypothetical protein